MSVVGKADPLAGYEWLASTPDGVKLVGRDGVVRYMNAAGLAQMEMSDAGQVIGRPWTSLWPEATRSQVEQAISEAVAGRASRFSGLRPTAKGVPRWWDIVVVPMPSAEIDKGMLLVVSRDISQQKQVEESLRLSEQRFRALANNIAQLAWLTDPDGNAFWYNQRWLDYTGTTLADMAEGGWPLVCHPDHLARVTARLAAAVRNGEPWEDVFPLRAADGSYRWFLSRAMPMRDATGKIELWCGTNTDVTETRTFSQRLRQLARLIELSHEAILVWDLDAGIVLWNRGCEELYGYTKSAALGRSSHELLKTDHTMPLPRFLEQIRTRGEWAGELRHVARDGTEVWVDSRQELVRLGGRSLVLETNRDITDRRRDDEIRNLLVGELSHRVKNTLAIVQSIASQTARKAATLPSFLASFEGRLQSLSSAHDVLSDAHWSGASIRSLLASQLAATTHEAQRVELDGPEVFLPAQLALQLTLIVHELTTNAVRFGALSMRGGRVSVTWTVGPGEHLELAWREIGGPAVSPPSARGFGLTVIERSSRLPNLNARLMFEPSGVVCVIAIDLRPAQTGAPGYFSPAGGASSPARRSVPQRRRAAASRRILIVDDDPLRSLRAEELLWEAGFITLGPSTNASDAMRSIAENRVDAVLLEAESPGLMPEQITAELLRRRIPVVLLDRFSAISPGVARVPKPLDAAQLIAALHAITVGDIHIDDPVPDGLAIGEPRTAKRLTDDPAAGEI